MCVFWAVQLACFRCESYLTKSHPWLSSNKITTQLLTTGSFFTRGDGAQCGAGNGGTAGEEQVGGGVTRGGGYVQVAEAWRISITARCCYQGYSDMQANCRCQADNSEAQLETLGEGR